MSALEFLSGSNVAPKKYNVDLPAFDLVCVTVLSVLVEVRGGDVRSISKMNRQSVQTVSCLLPLTQSDALQVPDAVVTSAAALRYTTPS